MKKLCSICNREMTGRSDKLYCSLVCKNKHNNLLHNPVSDYVKQIDTILHRNHHILTVLLAASKIKKVKFDKLVLIRAGFDFTHFTGTYLNNQGKLYHYVYDFAWMEFSNQEVLVVRK